jgi:hypothetical protein
MGTVGHGTVLTANIPPVSQSAAPREHTRFFFSLHDASVAIQQKSSVCIGETFLSKENINWKKRTRLAVLFSFSGADRADERVGCQGDGGGWRGACATFVL